MSVYYEKGVYLCEVINQAIGETSTGKPQFVLRFRVLGTPDPEDPDNYFRAPQQYERTHYRVITEKTVDYFVEDLKALGFRQQSFRYLDPETPGFHNFVGQIVSMYCYHDTYEGKENEKWGVARGMSEFAVKPLDTKKMRELDNLFGKKLKELPLETPKADPAKANPFKEPPSRDINADLKGTEITESDIPF